MQHIMEIFCPSASTPARKHRLESRRPTRAQVVYSQQMELGQITAEISALAAVAIAAGCGGGAAAAAASALVLAEVAGF